jgi:hypothetical protein
VNNTIITDIKKYKKGWSGGLPETPCGFGSRLGQTKVQRQWIPAMVEKYGIRTINDIGAGDLNWIPSVDWPHPVEYMAYDLVPRHPSVQEFDLLHTVPPAADLSMCLWVLNHMPPDQARVAQDNLLASGSKYLMVTWWDEMDDFLDLEPIEETIIRTAWPRGRKIDYWIRLVKC